MSDNTGSGSGNEHGKSSSSAMRSSSTASARSHRDSLTLGPAPASPRLNANRSSILAETFRNIPLSPRQQRAPSFSQSAVQDLVNDPPPAKITHPTFGGRDWKQIQVQEVVDESHVRFVDTSTSVEKATELLISSGSPNVVLIRDYADPKAAIGTFDYSDLNAYLLLVVGLAQPDENQLSRFQEVAQKGREGKEIPLKDVKDLGRKEPLIFLAHTSPLTKAIEIFASGIHRIVVVQERTTTVVGVLTQLRLVEFFWENRANFSPIEPLFHSTLRDLDLGSHAVFAINGDKPLTSALEIINNEGITSLPVLDNQRNVIGNISHVDVRLLTKSTAPALLRGTCLNFISVILSERGIDDGADSYPVFYVNHYSTLAHTVAKLVATRSHRMWVVDSPSPASSAPQTPNLTQTTMFGSSSTSHPPPQIVTPPIATAPSTGPPYSSTSIPSQASAISASGVPGASVSGILSGVVSLTDILNVFARASGLNPIDPAQVRQKRRRSSSSSMRRSMESNRSESVGGSSAAGDSSRRGSISGRRM